MTATPNVVPRDGAAERLARMIQLRTVSAQVEQTGPAQFEQFLALLRELYPLVHEHLELARPSALSLLFRWPGQRVAADGPLVLMAHYDVVPIDESDSWTYPPFEGRIVDGWVHGRGALDDKGPLAVILEATENLLAAGFVPARDVYLSFGGDEETHGSAALANAETLRAAGIVPWLVLDEGGAVVREPLPFVQGQAAMVGLAEKGALTMELSARGAGGHASAPPTVTAVRRVGRAVARLGPATFRPHMSRTVAGMLRAFADRAQGPARPAYRAMARLPWLPAQLMAAAGGEPAALVRTTVAATMLDGGTAANVLPSQASATVNLRIAVDETVAGTLRRIRRRIADPRVEVRVVSSGEPTRQSPADNAQFALIADAVAASHPGAATVPYLMMQASDARHFHRFSPAVYRFAPLEMSAAQRAAIHGVDERVAIAALTKGELFHRTLIQHLP